MNKKTTHKNLYVVSDVHSYYDALIKALSEAGFFEDKDGVLLLLGDALDRGSKPLELIDFLFELQEEDRLIYIRGNHEEILSNMLQSISNRSFQSKFASYAINGTFDTALSLANMYYDEEKKQHVYYNEDNWCYMDCDKAQEYSDELVRRIKESKYYKELHRYALDYYETDNYIFCHGWIPVYISGSAQEPVYDYDPEWRDAEYSRWSAARWLNGMDVACHHHITEPRKTIFCGHWHTSWGHERFQGNRGLTEPFVDEGIIAIDAGTFHNDTDETKKVNCVVIKEDGAYFEGKLIHAPEEICN